jgi:hypothetical protein
MITAFQNNAAEWSLKSAKTYKDPFNEVKLRALVTDPRGVTRKVPFFWGGGDLWRVRYASPLVGIHTFTTECNDSENPDLHGISGSLEVKPYAGDNPLYKHGAVRRAQGRLHLEHADDGKPFFWLADTWWMGLTSRLSWPGGFMQLAADRKAKGFSVVQIIAGLYPDMEPFDPRGANEAGFPWDREFTSVNPAYFDAADLKIAWLVEQGISPCIVGCWGFFVPFFGKENIMRHWEYLIARWAAYPVIWCAGGEANMMFYGDWGKVSEEEHLKTSRADWTGISAFIKKQDPFGRLLTIHPTQNGREQVNDESLLDLDMLQTGHGSFNTLLPSASQVKKALDRRSLPVIVAEACYEGISGTSGPDVQRYLFWSSVLLGCCGHTYGANGIWQLNSMKEKYGLSPHGATWGDTPWEEAYRLPGSEQVGLGKRFLEGLPWERFEYRPDWVEKPFTFNSLEGAFAAGVEGECRVIFMPYLGGFFWGETGILKVEKNRYRAFRFDPVDGSETDLGSVDPDEKGLWRSPRVHKFQDWILVLVTKQAPA